MIVVNEGIKIDYEGVKGKGQWFKRCKSLMRVNYEGVNIRGKLLMKIYTLYESCLLEMRKKLCKSYRWERNVTKVAIVVYMRDNRMTRVQFGKRR